MANNLVIVESPAKAKTIENYLGKDFTVMSSYGHIRDLPNKELGVDIENNFEPTYVVSSDKTKLVNDLKKQAKGAVVWLATDDDREGEAISWHLKEALKLGDDTKRIVFREITKKAITAAIQNPRIIDIDLVNAQQARRILDRLVGFQVSPVLWNKIRISGKDRKNLSAGRVQSVAVRIIVEREREIENFEVTSTYKVVALFLVGNGKILKAELPKNFKTEGEAKEFVEKCIGASFTIKDLETKPAKKSPAPPFTTSTLQQEASRKLSFSVAQTMSVAQKLYEAGRISYMRTDSTNLSDDAIENATQQIGNEYGSEYIKVRKYKTKNESAQEAHEAIRPTDFSVTSTTGDRNERRLYELIWKRAIASQMADAQLERTTATIDISTTSELLIAKGEVIKFEGFLKVYLESSDDEEDEENSDMLPPLTIGQRLALDKLTATERFTKPAARYTEASLVKKMEEMGIGRPSTYAPTISTIIKRTYVIKEDREGSTREYQEYVLKNDKITVGKSIENFGTEKSKLFPTNLGIIVNDFLVDNFQDIVDFQFTAKVEEEFDEVAEGKVPWRTMIDKFYKGLAPKLKEADDADPEKRYNSTELGTDPESGKPVFAKLGKFGPYIQVGEATDEEKPTFVSLPKGTLLENVTIEYALELISKPKLPLELGVFEDHALVVNNGRYGPYILHNSKYYNLDKDADPYDYDYEKAVAFIKQKRIDSVNELPRDLENYDDLPVMIGKGRYGPYIKHGDKYYNLDKNENPMTVSMARVIEMIEEGKQKEANKYIKEFAEDDSIKVLNGRYGPYIKVGKRNVKIPKDVKPEELTLEMCKELASK